MSNLQSDMYDTTSSQDSKYDWLLSNSTGSLLFDYHKMNWHRWDDPSEDRVCWRNHRGLQIHEIESADIIDNVPMKPEISNEVALDLSHFKEQVKTILGELSQVRAVFIWPQDDGYEVYTVLGTRDRRVRNRLFEKELAIHDLFPEALLDFKVSMSPTLPTSKDLPKNAIKCFSR